MNAVNTKDPMIPPMTPPAIAPAFEWDKLEASKSDETEGVNVGTTTIPGNVYRVGVGVVLSLDVLGWMTGTSVP